MSEKNSKMKLRFNRKGLWWKIPLALVGAISLMQVLSGNNGLPKCASDKATSTLSNVFNKSSVATTNNLTLIDVYEIREVKGSTKSQRNCSAILTLSNDQKVAALYKMNIRDDGQYALEFQLK